MKRRSELGLALGAGLSAACRPLRPFGAEKNPGRWERRSELVTPRDDFGLAQLAGKLLAIGGMTGDRGNALDSVESYDPVVNIWGREPRLPLPLSSLRATTVGRRLVTAGGAVENEETGATFVLDTLGSRWEVVRPMPTPRLGHGLAALGATVYAAGGLRAGEPLAALDAYDVSRDRWTALAPLPSPKFNLSLVSLGGKLYAVGGSGADRRPTPTVDVYAPEQDRWTSAPALPVSMSNFGAAAAGDHAIHAVLHRDHLVLNVGSATWTRALPTSVSRHGLGLLWHEGLLYAIGGCSEDPQRDLAVVEVFHPPV